MDTVTVLSFFRSGWCVRVKFGDGRSVTGCSVTGFVQCTDSSFNFPTLSRKTGNSNPSLTYERRSVSGVEGVTVSIPILVLKTVL